MIGYNSWAEEGFQFLDPLSCSYEITVLWTNTLLIAQKLKIVLQAASNHPSLKLNRFSFRGRVSL